jgi:hypothetical protein
VHQLRHQQPEAFEFSDAFLVELATYAQSEWFADFVRGWRGGRGCRSVRLAIDY